MATAEPFPVSSTAIRCSVTNALGARPSPIVVQDAVKRVVVLDSPPLSFRDVGPQQVAPPDDPDEEIEQDRLDAADDHLQVPMTLLVQEMPERLPVLGLEPEPTAPEEPPHGGDHEE